MRLLFLGDVVGRPGRAVVLDQLPALRERWNLDCVVVNGENAAGGFGISEAICDELIAAGADAVTLGNHSFDQREALVFIARQPRLIRPANYPPGTPGRGATVVETRGGAHVLVVNVMGRVFLDPMDDPFAAVEREVSACPLGSAADAIVVDVHAEATSEKQALGHYLDGRVSLVVGTHTHTPTADHRILPGGTAYMSDAGMCGTTIRSSGCRSTSRSAASFRRRRAPAGRWPADPAPSRASRSKPGRTAWPPRWRPCGSARISRKAVPFSGIESRFRT